MPRRSQEPQVRTMAPGATVTVMDGSMGRQLVVEGLPRGDLFHKIWAASALADPDYHELIVSSAVGAYSFWLTRGWEKNFFNSC